MSNGSSHHIMFCVVCTSLFLFFTVASSCDDSKEFLTPFTPTITSVAHRGYKIHGAAENTAEAYRYAKDAGFQYGETDIQWTKDNIPVCCHDNYFFDKGTNDSITIGQYTLDEIVAVRDIEILQARQHEEKIAYLRKALAKAPAPSQKTIAIVFQQN